MPQRNSTTPIFHIALVDDWSAALDAGEYTMSTRGVTLADEGFIHCSTIEQVEPTANRFYADIEAVVLLAIDQRAMNAPVKWEPPAPGIDELFPHVYGPIPLAAVGRSTMWYRPGPTWSLQQLDP